MNSSARETRLFVGQAGLRGALDRYARQFDLVEVAAEPGKHPRRAGLLAWRKSAPESFAFAVVVPGKLASLEATDAEKAELLAHSREVATALSAAWWVVRTPPSVTPSARSTRGLTALFDALREDGRRIAWEPRGPWSDEGVAHTARALGVHLVRDLAREDRLDSNPIVYTRLRALGEGVRVSAATAERVADRLDGVSEAYVVVEGQGARGLKRVLAAVLADAEDDDDATDVRGDSRLRADGDDELSDEADGAPDYDSSADEDADSEGAGPASDEGEDDLDEDGDEDDLDEDGDGDDLDEDGDEDDLDEDDEDEGLR